MCCCMCSAFVFPQAGSKGTVKDAETNQPISKATIYANNKVLTIANEKGEFTVPPGVTVITVSFIGYTSVSVTVTTGMTVALTRTENELKSVEITATSNKNKQLLYQPQSITKLSEVELKRGNGLFLDDAINSNVPGVTMSRRTVSAGQQFNIRGYGNGVRGTNGINSNFDGQGYRVYLNGISLTDAEGITLLDDIDFGSIGNVEITKGPAGTLYGLAIAGVVNLSTIQPEKGKTSLTQDVLLGSYGLRRYTTGFQSGSANSSLLVNFGYQQTDGYMTHTASTKRFFNVAGTVKISDRESLAYYAGHTNSYDERGGELTIAQYLAKDYSGNPEYIKRNAHSEVISFKAGIVHSYNFSKGVSNTTSVFGSGISNNASSAGGWTDKSPVNYGIRSTFDFRFDLQQGVALTGIAGLEAQKQNAQIIGYNMVANPNDPAAYWIIGAARSNQQTITAPTSVFTEWTLALPKDLSVTAGVGSSTMMIRLDDKFYVASNTNPTRFQKTYRNMVSPHVAINKVFSKQVSLYASYSKGYKAPVSSYFFIPTTGQLNTNLKPEAGNQFEIGSKGTVFHNKLDYQLAVFQATFSDKMYAQPVPLNATTTAYTYIANGGKQVDRGVEAALRYRIYESATGAFRSIRPFANLTYSDFKYQDYKFRKGTTNELQDYSGFAVAGVPKWVFNAGVDVAATQGLYLNLTYNYKDKMPVTSDNLNIAGSYNLLNGKIGIRHSLSKHFDVDAYAGATNLSGVQYYYMVFVNQLPDAYIPAPLNTNWFGGVNLKYNF